jgi:hypothetical protein
MTSRDAQLKAYKEYQSAVKEAEKKKPEGSWYRIPAEDNTDEGRLIYDPSIDGIELSLANCSMRISGKYLKSIQSALNSLLGGE